MIHIVITPFRFVIYIKTPTAFYTIGVNLISKQGLVIPAKGLRFYRQEVLRAFHLVGL